MQDRLILYVRIIKSYKKLILSFVNKFARHKVTEG